MDDTPDMQVLKAIRITISIPLYFKPYKYNNKIWIDGACANNYPIEPFIDKIDDVIGILLEDNMTYIENFDEVDKYIYRIIKCIVKGECINKYNTYKNNTIQIICDFEIFDFEITTEIKKNLFLQGYDSAKEFYN